MKIKLLLLVWLVMIGISCGDGAKYVTIQTEMGNMTIKLFDSTPQHRDNFIKLIKESYYDDLLFHRVINGFMIQGGDPESKNAPTGKRLGGGGPGYTIPAEIGAPHFKGALAAARTGGPSNPEKRSSGSQFYIVHGTPINAEALENMARSKGLVYNQAQKDKYLEVGGTPGLDNDYTVFGELISGWEVIDKIAAVATDPSDRPIKDVKMTIRMGK